MQEILERMTRDELAVFFGFTVSQKAKFAERGLLGCSQAMQELLLMLEAERISRGIAGTPEDEEKIREWLAA